jgi:hypothetical protein
MASSALAQAKITTKSIQLSASAAGRAAASPDPVGGDPAVHGPVPRYAAAALSKSHAGSELR